MSIEENAVKTNNFKIPGVKKSSPFDNSELIRYAIRDIVGECTNYWVDTNKFKTLLDGDRLFYVWNTFPDLRPSIMNMVVNQTIPYRLEDEEISSVRSKYKRIARLALDEIGDSLAKETSALKVNLSNFLGIDIDYLSIVSSLEESGEDDSLVNHWIGVGIKNSKSELFFEEAFFRIKRSPGSTELKKEIVSAANNAECLSDKIINRVVKSSPISLKRSVVSAILSEVGEINSDIWRIERKKGYDNATEADLLNLERLQGKVDSLQEKLILFAPVTDRQIQRDLIENVSKDNLVWLVPAVSQLGNSWLSRSLERRLNS